MRVTPLGKARKATRSSTNYIFNIFLGNSYDLGENITGMTEEKAILTRIHELPEQLKREVLDYIEFLQKKYARRNGKPKNRKAGSAKGKYKLAPDFDEPLEDFKEYV